MPEELKLIMKKAGYIEFESPGFIVKNFGKKNRFGD
jgi:hypothetical protein